VVGEDLVQSDPDTLRVERSLAGLDFLVVQDLFPTETAEFAHVVLPACSALEKGGTFTNSERRVQRVRPVVSPFAGSRSDGRIFCDVMRRFGVPQDEYGAERVFGEITEVVPFLAGATWDGLGEHGKQWPILANGEGTPVLHAETFKRGRGKFHFFPWVESGELALYQETFPLVLITGRLLEQYNSGTMTRRVGINRLVGEDLLAIHPEDARRRNISTGDRVRISSARAEVVLSARVTDEVETGVVFTTFHFPELLVNRLTGQGHDEETMCPEYKVVAVEVARC
jgi:formate dehydrogenase major subunit